ncbi:MAG: M48 family metalloprotease [candidate division Zixibacteria bacterium]|nr:M48 family metalloprotease [candidate division Zixibacteria bacterium]
MTNFRPAALTLAILCFTSPLFAAVLREAAEAAKSYEGKTLYLRKTLNQSRKVYLNVPLGEFYYEYKKGRMFPLREPVQVQITKVESKENVKFSIISKQLGKTEIELKSADGSPITKQAVEAALRRAFSTDWTDDAKLFVGSKTTKTLHVDGCNHMPEEKGLVRFASVSDAEGAGFRKCLVCFRQIPTVSGFEKERVLGQQTASAFRNYNPVVTDDRLNDRVKNVGYQVLENWPAPLKGYNYKFYVVENDVPNAVACPAGQIFVTTGLLDAVESDEELEGVLAHEITHVEMRHGYRQFRAAQKGQAISTAAGIVAGVITAAKSKKDKVEKGVAVANVVTLLGNVSTAIALSGYSRGYEEEADSYALAYLATRSQDGAGRPYLATLRKLRYYSDIEEISEDAQGLALFQSHPNIAARVDKAQNLDVAPIQNALFYGLNKEGELVATLSFEMQAFSAYRKRATGVAGEKTELRVFVTLETTPNLGDKDKVRSVALKIARGEVILDNKEDTEILPSDLVGCTFYTNKLEDFIPAIQSVKLPLKNVSRWVKAGD